MRKKTAKIVNMSAVTTQYVEAAGGIIYRKRNTTNSSNADEETKISN